MVKPKRSSLCPACKTPKNYHAFATPNKHCAGPPENDTLDEDAEDVISEDKTSPLCQVKTSPPAASSSAVQSTTPNLLDAMRNLSLQLESLTKEQMAMKQCMDEISTSTAHAVGPLPSPTPDTSLPVHCAFKTNHFPEKFATAAVNGEYVDFSDVLSSLSILRSPQSDEGMLRSFLSDLTAIARSQ